MTSKLTEVALAEVEEKTVSIESMVLVKTASAKLKASTRTSPVAVKDFVLDPEIDILEAEREVREGLAAESR